MSRGSRQGAPGDGPDADAELQDPAPVPAVGGVPDDNSIANTQWAVQAVRNHDDALASEKVAFARAWAAATAIGKDRKRHKAMLAAYDHSFETLLPLAQDLVALWDQRQSGGSMLRQRRGDAPDCWRKRNRQLSRP